MTKNSRLGNLIVLSVIVATQLSGAPAWAFADAELELDAVQSARLEEAYDAFQQQVEVVYPDELEDLTGQNSQDLPASIPTPTPTKLPSASGSSDADSLWGTIKRIPGDSKAVVVAPFHWNKQSWLKALFVVSLTAGASTQDENVKSFAQARRTTFTNSAATAFRQGGEVLVVAPALLATYGIARLAVHNDKLAEASLRALEGATVTDIFNSLTKFLAHRTRPYASDTAHRFSGPSFKNDESRLSFSSGHTSTAFAVATAFASVYRDNAIIPILAYSAATLTGLSRINDNQHWLSDTVFGAVTGIAITRLISSRREKDASHASVWSQATPVIDVDERGNRQFGVQLPLPRIKRH